MYTAVVLSPSSAALLQGIVRGKTNLEELGFVFMTDRMALPHHMTINMGRLNPSLNDPDILGQRAMLSGSLIAYDVASGVCAAKISSAKIGERELHTANAQAHVTVCLRPHVRPKESNTLFASNTYESVTQDFALEGIVQQCP